MNKFNVTVQLHDQVLVIPAYKVEFYEDKVLIYSEGDDRGAIFFPDVLVTIEAIR